MEKKKQVKAPFPVTVFKVTKRNLTKYLYFTGVTKAIKEVEVYPKVTGKIYQQVVKSGDRIAKGQILFTIDRDVTGYKFEKAKVTSPIAGRVSLIYSDVGDYVTPKTPLALIQDDSKVIARIWVGGVDYPWIKEGERAFVITGDKNVKFEGKVKEISPFFDPVTHTALVEIEIDNPKGEIKPGMFAEVMIVVAQRDNVLAVPFDAILKDEGGDFVYVVKNGVAYKRYLKIGLRSSYYFEVTQGLKENELVVHLGEEFLKDSVPVKIIRE